MNITQLQYFIAISQHKSMRKAAEALYVSQPSISSSLKNLEKELGFSLFTRSSSGLSLTENGKKALVFAKKIVKNYNDLVSLDNHTAINNTRAVINIGIIPSISSFLPQITNRFKSVYPNTIIHIYEDSTKDLLNSFAGNIYDFGIICMDIKDPFKYRLPPNIQSKILFQSPVCAIVNSHHPLTQEKILTQKKLLGYPIAIHSSNENDLRTIEEVFTSQKPKVALSSNNLSFVYNYITQNDCFAISFEFMQSLDIFLQNDLVSIPIKNKTAAFCCLFNKNFPKQELLEQYASIIEEYFNQSKQK